ncbi:J domain-containing protein [Aeoliella sp.]|uniref:J domain-containing protein n=1 Tax=Aeoliella sp. TaxID=2795800 RepID=UPI003CCBEEFC
MADTADNPNWDLLPQDPIRFFALADGFDRKDLKRAYNRLLRVYKPEKFPAEFQKIRAAYEQLDEQLRYHGGAAPQRVPTPQDWKTDESGPADAATPQKLEPTLAERLKTESPAALFQELKQRENKSPYDFYALALLSDVVEKSPTGFVKWLIEGIATHRRDGALKQLLHDYFRGPQQAKLLLKILPAVAKAVRTDEFYPLTEPAWQTVMRECNFNQFTATYDRCERELRDSHIVGRMAFLIHTLKSALWRDEQLNGWSAAQLRFIEENFSNIPPWLEWDVELLGLAREYLLVRRQFAAGSPLRSRMDAALKDYFSESQEVGDHSMVAAQMELLSAGDALMDEFPVEQSELLHKFYPIWAWASHDVAERQSFKQETEVNQEVWVSRGAALLARLEKECNNSLTGVTWSLALFARWVALAVGVLIGSLIVISIYAGVSTSMEQANQDTLAFVAVLVMILGIVGVAVLVLYYLRPVVDQKLWFPLNAKFAQKCYNQMWRREVLDFQRRSHVPDQFFCALFQHFADRSATSTWVNEFVQQDIAPALLAGAQRYEA